MFVEGSVVTEGAPSVGCWVPRGIQVLRAPVAPASHGVPTMRAYALITHEAHLGRAKIVVRLNSSTPKTSKEDVIPMCGIVTKVGNFLQLAGGVELCSIPAVQHPCRNMEWFVEEFRCVSCAALMLRPGTQMYRVSSAPYHTR